MIPLLKRHEVQVLLKAGHTQKEVATFSGISERTVRRIGEEVGVQHVDDNAERQRRKVGRPSKAAAYRELVEKMVSEEPGLMSLEILRRVRLQGYRGGKSAMYELISELRPRGVKVQMRCVLSVSMRGVASAGS